MDNDRPRGNSDLMKTCGADNAESQPSYPKEGARILDPLFKRDKLFLSVIILSLAVVLFNIAYIYFNPPVDGDSYEYAGLARNFLRYGELRATHVTIMFPYSEQTLPRPSVFRANLWAFVILPFQVLFGNSVWSFVIPFQITVFLLGPIVYLFALNFFSRKVAFASAVAIIFNPRILIWATREDPGNSDIFSTIIFILATLFFLKRRWLAAGILTGLTFLTKINGLILFPLFTFWLLLFDRKEFGRRGFYIFVLSAAVCCSPMLIRNALVFGNPIHAYVDSFRHGSEKNIKKILMARKQNASAWYTFDENEAEESEPMPLRLKILYRLEFLYLNFKSFFFGNYTGLSWYPGFFETLTLVLTPFLFLGAWRCRGDPAKFMVVLFVSVHLLTLVLFKSINEDRYLFPSLAFGAILAFYGVEQLAGRFKWLSIKNILILFILIETLPAFGMTALNLFGKPDESMFVELRAVCEWVKAETPKDAVLMTMPFWSPHYFCDRYTVPPTTGNLESLKKVTEQFHADYFLFYEIWGGDRVPRFTFMEPLLRGRFLTLYRIDRSHPDFINLNRRYTYMKDFDFLGYFWKGRLMFKTDPSIANVFYLLTGSVFDAGAIFLMVCLGTLWLISRPANRTRYVGYPALLLALFICKHAAIAPVREMIQLDPPPASRYQAEHYLSEAIESKRIKRVVIAADSDGEGITSLFSGLGFIVGLTDEGPIKEVVEGEARFVAINEKDYYISSLERAREVNAIILQENKEFKDVENELKRLGYRTEPIAGGVLGIQDTNKQYSP
ncbi:MAG: glycosyltransferase family 39 protein [bacterium]